MRPVILKQCQNDEVGQEQSRREPHDRVDFVRFSFYDFHDAVEEEAGCDTVGNAVRKTHEDGCEESRDCIFQIMPVDFRE